MSTGHHGHGELGHVIPNKVFFNILVILLVLTVITVGISQVDFGEWNIVVALLIASAKALLVMLFFMHLKFENPILWLYAAIPVLLIAIMVGGVFVDTPFRHMGTSSGEVVHEAPVASGHH